VVLVSINYTIGFWNDNDIQSEVSPPTKKAKPIHSRVV